MDTVTYPQDSIINFINQNLIPLRIPSDQQPLATEFGVTWTPALFILDEDGNEHHRSVGFLDADQLIPSLLLGIGNMHFTANNFKEALSRYETILSQHPGSDAAPEAVFQKGVSLFKSTNDPKPLREAYELLSKTYKDSPWTNRAYPYRLIP